MLRWLCLNTLAFIIICFLEFPLYSAIFLPFFWRSTTVTPKPPMEEGCSFLMQTSTTQNVRHTSENGSPRTTLTETSTELYRSCIPSSQCDASEMLHAYKGPQEEVGGVFVFSLSLSRLCPRKWSASDEDNLPTTTPWVLKQCVDLSWSFCLWEVRLCVTQCECYHHMFFVS